jgi:hypothetical protein
LPAITHTLKTRNQLNEADQALAGLKEKINFDTTLAKRMNWFKRIKFGGTKIGGHIPIGWKTLLNNNVIVQGPQLRRHMRTYLFDYRYQRGDVRLKELELESEL